VETFKNRLECIMNTQNLSRTERIDVRASTPVKQLLQDAARACHKNVSEFQLDAGMTAAAKTLADRRQFVHRYALVNQKANCAQTYVCCQSDMGVGFYSLAVGSVARVCSPGRLIWINADRVSLA